MRSLAAAGLLPLAVLATDDVGPTLWKERAAASRTQWETRDETHPDLGRVRSAVTRSPVETSVAGASVFTRAGVSCEPGTRRMAIELENSLQEPGARGQRTTLAPAAMPTLLCSRPIAPWDAKLVQEELAAKWDVDPASGAALARGLRPFPLRECVVIRAEQTVVLQGGAKARVDFEILPYARELDAVFTACGERSAYAPTEPARVATASLEPPPTPEPQSAWRRARVSGTGKTNVRAAPSLKSAVVAQVAAGSAVLVQATDSEWWKARATRGGSFTGYIRQDRLALD